MSRSTEKPRSPGNVQAATDLTTQKTISVSDLGSYCKAWPNRVQFLKVNNLREVEMEQDDQVRMVDVVDIGEAIEDNPKPIISFRKPASDHTSSPFLHLARETRLAILELVVDSPRILYNYPHRAMLPKGHGAQILACCQLLLYEGRSVLYGRTTIRMGCEWVNDWSRLVVAGGRVVTDSDLANNSNWDLRETRLLEGYMLRSPSLPSSAAVHLFGKVEITMLDNFLVPAFAGVFSKLKELVIGKDVKLKISRQFPVSELECFSGWSSNSITVENTGVYPGLRDLQNFLVQESLRLKAQKKMITME